MPAKRLPSTDEGRIRVLQAIIDQEELIGLDKGVLSIQELHELRNFLLAFEGSGFCFRQAMDDENKAGKVYSDLFKTAQLYISHFIQVLHLAVIRNEIKRELLVLYGMDENDLSVPDLSTEEDVLNWGERLIVGEAERMSRGGAAMYNPPIAKVKVHYDLFKDALYSLKIYRKNTIRNHEGMDDRRQKADRYIEDIWTRVEDRCWEMEADERKTVLKAYAIIYYYQRGEQLDVFG